MLKKSIKVKLAGIKRQAKFDFFWFKTLVWNCHFFFKCVFPVKDTKLTLKTADSFLAGTNGDVYVKLKGSQGESDFEQITEGGMIADENERGA